MHPVRTLLESGLGAAVGTFHQARMTADVHHSLVSHNVTEPAARERDAPCAATPRSSPSPTYPVGSRPVALSSSPAAAQHSIHLGSSAPTPVPRRLHQQPP